MKRNKKGFTLVELVIVIAVIAILAGVMVAVFSGVIRRANESAELQKVKNEEIAQKADDILKKIDNANWFSWEDFENSLAEKLTETYKKYAKNEGGATTEQIEAAVKKAIAEYAASTATENTSLTEAQVKAIVENALANAKLGGVTEAQVRTIVNTAVDGITTLSKSDVQKIVDAAVAKGLTADQVANVIGNSGLAKKADITAVETKVDTVIAALNALNPVTNKDLEDKIIDLLPVTKTADGATAFTELVGRLNSGSTIIVGWDASSETLKVDDAAGDKTLTIKGNKVGTLTVNAPKASLYVLCDVETLDVVETAQNSVHVKGKVTTLTANKGRVVLEAGAEVENLKAAPSKNAVVTIALEAGSKITDTLETEYQEHGFVDGNRDFIYIENNGNVNLTNLTASTALQAATAVHTTTNVVITNGTQGTRITEDKIEVDTKVTDDTIIKIDEATGYVQGTDVVTFTSDFAGGTGTEADPFLIIDYDTFQKVSEYYTKGYYYFKVKDGIKHIDCANWVSVKLNGSFDGNGVALDNLDTYLFYCADGEEVTIENFTINANISSTGAAGAVLYYPATFNLTLDSIVVHGYVEGGANSGLFIAFGPGDWTGSKWVGTWTATFENCSSDATVINTNGNASQLIGHPCCDNTLSKIYINNFAFTGQLYSNNDNGGRKYSSVNTFNIFYVDGAETPTASNTAATCTKLNVIKETLPDAYSTFTVTKKSGFDHAKAVLIISPNGKNEIGGFTGTYMVESSELIVTDSTIATKNIKNFDIKVNDEDTDVAVRTFGDSGYTEDGTTYNVVNTTSYGTTYANASVRITQYDSSNNIIGISVFTLPVVNS